MWRLFNGKKQTNRVHPQEGKESFEIVSSCHASPGPDQQSQDGAQIHTSWKKDTKRQTESEDPLRHPMTMNSLLRTTTERKSQTATTVQISVQGSQPGVEQLSTDKEYQTTPERRNSEEHTVSVDPTLYTNAERPSPIATPSQGSPRTDIQPTETALGPQVSDELPVIVDTQDLDPDDVVIALMGPTGSGKSTFIRRASGHDDRGIGHELRSYTQDVIAIRFRDQHSGRSIVLVDTPGFDDTFKSDLEILNMISDWLNSSYKDKKLLSAILYLHRITDNRMAGTPLKNLRVFRKLCGRDALDKVYLTTTMWDEVEVTTGKQRLEELQKEYWKSMIEQGAHIFCSRNDDDSANRLVQEILDHDAVRKALRLQREIADEEKDLKETKAGQELFDQLENLVERQLLLLRRIDKERKAASDASVLAELQQEYVDLRGQIDGKMHQMQQLKLSWMKNLVRKARSVASRT